jgi:hypothetical protein
MIMIIRSLITLFTFETLKTSIWDIRTFKYVYVKCREILRVSLSGLPLPLSVYLNNSLNIQKYKYKRRLAGAGGRV